MPNDAVATVPLKAWRYCRWFLRQIATQFRDDGCTAAAAALTFTTMIAVVPFVAIIYRILSLLPEFEGVGDKITSFVFQTFLPGSSDAVLEKVLEFSAKANELTLVGIGVVFVTTMLMLMRMEESFNRIWHVANTRAGLTRFLSYWGIISFGVPMIGVAVTAASYDGMAYLAELRGSALMDVLREAVPPIATALTFTFLYFAVPSCRVRFPHALVGGVVTTILLAVANEAFARVVPLFQNDLVYGAFAALPLFVMGLYLVWVMILVGAICARTLSLIPWEDETGRGPGSDQMRASAGAVARRPPRRRRGDGRRHPPCGADDAHGTRPHLRRVERRPLAAAHVGKDLGAWARFDQHDVVATLPRASGRHRRGELRWRQRNRGAVPGVPCRRRRSSRRDPRQAG